MFMTLFIIHTERLCYNVHLNLFSNNVMYLLNNILSQLFASVYFVSFSLITSWSWKCNFWDCRNELVHHFSFINLKSKWCIKLRTATFRVQTEQIETLEKFHAGRTLSCFIIIPLRLWNAIWTCYRFIYRLHFTAQKRKTNRLFNGAVYLRSVYWWVKAIAQGEPRRCS